MNIRSYMLRLFSLFVVLFVLFSNTLIVHATEIENNYSILENTYDFYVNDPNIMLLAETDANITLNILYREHGTETYNHIGATVNLDPNKYYDFYYEFILPEVVRKDTIFNILIKLRKGSLDISNADCSAAFLRGSWDDCFFYSPNLYVKNSDICFKSDSNITATCDIDRVCLYLNNVKSTSSTFTHDFHYFQLLETNDTGIINTILTWVKNIFHNIASLPENIANSIKGFFDNVVNALVTLGNTILDGVKALFVPTEEDITEMKDDWEGLLERRFGALYDCINIVHDYANAFTEENKSTITMPTVNLNFGGDIFSFGGWEVQVVPEGFNGVFGWLKIIIAITCTFLFVNGLKNRFEKLIGGSSNI